MKADDLDDFMRQAFSHPSVDGIIAWKWLWTEPNNKGQGTVSDIKYCKEFISLTCMKSWTVTKHFFDSKDNPEAIDNGTWPFFPNKAGNRWIDLVKGEWNSTFDVETNGAAQFDTRLYFGEYEMVQLDENGDILAVDSFKISQTAECGWSANSLIDGEFDSAIDHWSITGPDYLHPHPFELVNFDAYAGKAVKVSRSSVEVL